MIRILQSVNSMDRGGLETMIMNYYRNIDKEKVQFDFLTHRDFDGAFDEEIKSAGGKVFHAPRLMPQNLPKYYKFMSNFYKEHPEYHTIHSHIDTMSYFPLKAAKNSNVKNRIAHSHTSGYDVEIKFPIKWLAAKGIKNVTNINFACGKLAGEFLFPNQEFKIINNAIDLEKFKFNADYRNDFRKQFNLEDKYVIGHVGSYILSKNQIYLVDVLKEIIKENENAFLLFVGTNGNMEKKIIAKLKSYGLEDRALLLKNRSDVNKIYNAMDAFVMPSHFEGLPLVAIEAQANGLPCILSTGISKEASITSTTYMLDLKSGPKVWAKKILSFKEERNSNAVKEVRDAGYDIVIEAKKLQDFYLKIENE